MKAYYQILGVPKTASREEINKAYAVQAKAMHAGNGQASANETAFLEINEAFAILSQPSLKELYDLYLEQPEQLDQHDIALIEEAAKVGHIKGQEFFLLDFGHFVADILGEALLSGIIDGALGLVKKTSSVLFDFLSDLDLS